MPPPKFSGRKMTKELEDEINKRTAFGDKYSEAEQYKLMFGIYPHEDEPSKHTILNKKKGRPRKEQNILKARSDIIKSDSSKSGYVVDTQMNVKDNLTPKAKKALKLSLQEAIKQHIGV